MNHLMKELTRQVVTFIPKGVVALAVFIFFWAAGLLFQKIIRRTSKRVEGGERDIIIYRPFQYKDRISVAGCEGEVIEINLRYTTLQGENILFLIPNATLFSNSIRILK